MNFCQNVASGLKDQVLRPFQPRNSTFNPEDSECFTAAYKADRHNFFEIVPGKEFKDSDRIRMVEYALRHTRFGTGKDEIGITKLIGEKKAFEMVYPLHDELHYQGDGRR